MIKKVKPSPGNDKPNTNGGLLIDRARLSTRLEKILDVPLCVVRAPAGYGKTSLLTQWREQLVGSGRVVFALNLTTADVDPSWLVSRLYQVVRPPQDAARAGGRTQGPVDFSTLIEVISSLPPFVLFLDELEKLRSDASQRIIERLIESLPPHASVVIATRETPRFPIAALRVRNRLVEVGVDDLRFTRAEVAAVLKCRELDLDAETQDEVVVKTEGWAAAIQLVALALIECPEPLDFVQSLKGSRRDVADFLAEEVLLRQTPELQRFLTRTSVLDRLSAPVCNLLTGREDAQKVLEALYQQGMFLFAGDHERRWYRYHPLFADFLRDRLELEAPETLPVLHRLAALWHLEMGDAIEASEHASRADDLELAARIIAQVCRATFFEGHMATVAEWAERLPESLLAQHPEILEAAAWANACLRLPDKARARLAALKALNASSDLPATCRDACITVEPVILIYEDRDEEASALSRAAVGRLSGKDAFSMAAHDHVLAVGQISESDFEAARSVLLSAHARHGKAGSLFGSVYSVSLLGLCEAVQGKLGAARACYQEAEVLARSGDQASFYKTIVGAYQAELLYEGNDLDAAELLLNSAFERLTETAIGDMAAIAFLTMARLHAARGAVDYAHRALDGAEAHAIRVEFPRLSHYVQWERVRLALLARRLDLAERFRSRIDIPERSLTRFFHHAGEGEACDIGEIRFQIASGNAKAVLPWIRTLHGQARDLRRGWRGLRLKIFEAIALQVLGDHSAAVRSLLEALQFGSQHGFMRSFVDESTSVSPILRAIAESRRSGRDMLSDMQPGYLERVLVACGLRLTATVDDAGEAVPIEALSDRERQILEMVARGLSNRELAERLFVSEHTVKWHLLRVFQKLGVHNRSKAVAIARANGLIS